MLRKNGKDVEILRPLEHRRDVIVVVTNGTRRVCGDGSPFSSAELIQLSGLVESTTPRLKPTDDEQAQLDAAANSLERARVCVDNIMSDLEDLSTRLAAQYPSEMLVYHGGSPKTDYSAIDQINREAREAHVKLIDAHKTNKQALVEFNALNAQIMKAARARQSPIEYHCTNRSVDEQLQDLEGKE